MHLKTFCALGASALIAFANAASAAPVGYNFSITATEGSLTGSFVGDDLNTSGTFSLSEVLSFSVNATGTAFTGGPIVISAAQSVLTLFSFDLGSLALSFNVNNGLLQGNAGARGADCNPCAIGSILGVVRDNSSSGRIITAVSVSRVSGSVPEPASWLLVGTAAAVAGLARIRRRQSLQA